MKMTNNCYQTFGTSLFCLLILNLVSTAKVWNQQVNVYRTPGLTADQRSPFYAVDIAGKDADVYVSVPPPSDGRTDGCDFDRANKRSFSYLTFSFAGEIRVTVRKTSGTFKSVQLRPRIGCGRDFELVSENPPKGTVTLKITRPGAKVSVEFIDDNWDAQREIPRDALLIFADPLEMNDLCPPPVIQDHSVCLVRPGQPMKLTPSTRIVYFLPGLHDLSYWKVPLGIERAYLAGGAYVMGAIDARHLTHFKATGRGIISGEKFPWRARKDTLNPAPDGSRFWVDCLKLLDNSPDYLVEGITLVNASHFTCNVPSDPGKLKNIKILGSWHWNNDGVGVSRDSLVEGCFISAYDDAFKLYHSNARVSDCVVWQMNNGAVFQLGWGGKSPHDVTVQNIDVIHTEYTGTNENWGLVSLARHQGQGTIRNFRFNDIRMEGPVARIIGLHLHESPRQRIENMTFKNLSVDRILKPQEYPFYIGSTSSFGAKDGRVNVVGGQITGLNFTNFTISGQRLNEANFRQIGLFTVVGHPDLTFK